MKFIKKWYNLLMYDTKVAVKSFCFLLLIYIALSTCFFVDSTFNVDLTQDYKNLSCVMEDNRTQIQDLITRYENGSITVKDNYCIYFTKDKVDVTYYKNDNSFISELQINYLVDKNEDNFIISEKYNQNDKRVIANAISMYLVLILSSMAMSIVFILLIAFILKLCIIILGKINRFNR